MAKKPTSADKRKRKRYVPIRVSEEEYAQIKRAADPYPAATWSRVELLRLSREKLASVKKGGR